MYPGVRKFNVWIFLAIIIWAGQCAIGQTPTESVATLSLKSYGWVPPDRIPGHAVDGPWIAVDHQNRVLVCFTVQQRFGLVTRSEPSLDFHIVRFSRDGKLDFSQSLATNVAGRTGIYLSNTDQIIARANDRLQFRQADETNAAGWKVLTPCTLRCNVEQSVTRSTLLLYTQEADPPVTLIRLSFQPILKQCGRAHQFIKSVADTIQNYPQSITDKFAYHSGDNDTYRWPLCDWEHRIEMPTYLWGRYAALNDDLFAVDAISGKSYGDRELKVVSSEGRVMFQPEMAKHEFWGRLRSSEQGNRIAVSIFTRRGGNRKLDISAHVTAGRVAVYDIEARKQLASIPVSPKHRYAFEFELSPDGHRLALLEDDTIRVVDLDSNAKLAAH